MVSEGREPVHLTGSPIFGLGRRVQSLPSCYTEEIGAPLVLPLVLMHEKSLAPLYQEMRQLFAVATDFYGSNTRRAGSASPQNLAGFIC